MSSYASLWRLVRLGGLLASALVSHAEAQENELGRNVYRVTCSACHAPENVMVSAPKLGDSREWRRRASPDAAGLERLTEHALNGIGAMPPKGGNPALSRAQIQSAIEYMRQEVRGVPQR